MGSRMFRPRSWPLAAKISLDLILASLIPLIAAVWLTTTRGHEQLDGSARRNLSLLAGVTAAQLDQMILDVRRLTVQVSRDPAIERYCGGSRAQRAAMHAEVEKKLNVVVDSNPDFASMFIVNDAGIGMAATSATNVGMDFNFREYFQKARDGEVYVSEMLVGKTSSRPGIYFSAPVRSEDGGAIVGVVVLKLEGEVVWRLIEGVKVGQRGHAILTDADGVIIATPDKEMLYKSVGPLSPERIKEIDPETTWGKPTIHSLGIHTLMQVRSERVEKQGTVEFTSTSEFDAAPGERWIAGYCWMGERDWLVSIVEPEADFKRSMSELVREQVAIVVVVGALAGALALWRARGIVRPVRAVADAATRLSDGDFTARADKTSDDELGQLADAFNDMVPQLKERVDLQQSLAVAMEVQKSLLPAADPKPDLLDIAGRSKYCDATGGDYYDFLDVSRVSDTGAMVAVGDVMGHGVASALLMATARAALRSHVSEDANLASLMMKVNRVLASDARHNRFMTMALVVIDPVKGAARWASAGHDPTIVYHASDNTFDELEGGGVPLGMMEEEVYEQYSYAGLRHGDVLVIGTDGIWEMANPAGELYGKDRLREFMREHHQRPAREMADLLERELATFRGQATVLDDVTFVVIKVA